MDAGGACLAALLVSLCRHGIHTRARQQLRAARLTSFRLACDSHMRPPPSKAPLCMACRSVPPSQNSMTISVMSSGGAWGPAPLPPALPPVPLPLPLLLREEAAPRPASRSS